MANVDQNSRDIGKGVYFHKGKLIPIPLTYDVATGALLIEVIPHTIGIIDVPHRMPIDQNSYNVNGGVTNDSDKILTPISVDLIEGFPLLRVEIL